MYIVTRLYAYALFLLQLGYSEHTSAEISIAIASSAAAIIEFIYPV